MCFKRSMDCPFNPNKSLNPFAKEWIPLKSQKRPPFGVILQPTFQSLSPLPLLPLPQQAVQPVVTYSLHLPYYHLPLPTVSSYQFVLVYDTNSQYQLFHPSPLIPSRSDGRFIGETGCSFVEGKGLETGTEMKKEKNDFKDIVENPKVVRSSNDGCVNGVKRTKRFCPPRLFKGRRYSLSEKIYGCKLEWRSKEPVSSSTSPLDKDSCLSERTTIMIKNIPNDMRRDDLMDFLDSCCRKYCLEYDFLYLPMDFRTKKNLGYAFVNFTTASAALKIKKLLQNYRWDVVLTSQGSFSSKKICEITWAQIQGKEKLTRRFETSIFACDRLDFLPVTMDPPRNGSSSMSPPMVLGRCIAAK